MGTSCAAARAPSSQTSLLRKCDANVVQTVQGSLEILCDDTSHKTVGREEVWGHVRKSRAVSTSVTVATMFPMSPANVRAAIHFSNTFLSKSEGQPWGKHVLSRWFTRVVSASRAQRGSALRCGIRICTFNSWLRRERRESMYRTCRPYPLLSHHDTTSTQRSNYIPSMEESSGGIHCVGCHGLHHSMNWQTVKGSGLSYS